MNDVMERMWSFVRVTARDAPVDFLLVTRRRRADLDLLHYATWFEVTRLELTRTPDGVPHIGTLTTCVASWDPTWAPALTKSVPAAVAQVLIYGATSTTVLPFAQRVPRLPTAAHISTTWR